jgi:hypothetical protein
MLVHVIPFFVSHMICIKRSRACFIYGDTVIPYGILPEKTDMTPSSAIVVGTGVGSARPTRSCGRASAFGESATHAPAHSTLTLAVVLPDPRRQPSSLSPKPQPRTNLSALKSLRPVAAGPRSPSLPQASNSITRRSAKLWVSRPPTSRRDEQMDK